MFLAFIVLSLCFKCFIYLFIYIYIYIQLKSKMYIHLAESAKCWLFYQVRGITQNACYCLFSTDLNKIFHIKDVYMLFTRENNSYIYKNYPFQKITFA